MPETIVSAEDLQQAVDTLIVVTKDPNADPAERIQAAQLLLSYGFNERYGH